MNNMLIVSIMNLFFVILEIIGGIFTGSVSILSDAIHDLGDAISLFIAYILDKISLKKPNNKYTFGYLRYSLLGSIITAAILVIGCFFVIINAIDRIKNPVIINYDGMVLFAIVGFVINIVGYILTHKTEHINEKMISIHLLEDTLSWLLVLVVSIFMKFTSMAIIDPILSILISIYILCMVFKNIYKVGEIFLGKVPGGIDLDAIRKNLLDKLNISDIHHIHVWTLDGESNYITMHVLIEDEDSKKQIELKKEIKNILKEYGICHTTIEMEFSKEKCNDKICKVQHHSTHHHH